MFTKIMNIYQGRARNNHIIIFSTLNLENATLSISMFSLNTINNYIVYISVKRKGKFPSFNEQYVHFQ